MDDWRGTGVKGNMLEGGGDVTTIGIGVEVEGRGAIRRTSFSELSL